MIEPDLDGEPDPAVEDGTGVLVDAHGMEPDAVFALFKALGGDIPKLLVVGCEPAEVSERMELSPPVAGAVDQAVAVVRELLGEHETREGGMSMLRRLVLGAALVGLVAVLRKQVPDLARYLKIRSM